MFNRCVTMSSGRLVVPGITVVVLMCLVSYFYLRPDGMTLHYLVGNRTHFAQATRETEFSISSKGTSVRLHSSVLEELALKVQQSLGRLQNPDDCLQARIYLCRVHPTCGLGCTIHHIAPCLYNAVGMNRTLVVELVRFEYGSGKTLQVIYEPFSNGCTQVGNAKNPMDVKGKNAESARVIVHNVRGNYEPFTRWTPFTVPDVVLNELWGPHVKPDMWWLGQVLSFITRLNADARGRLEQLKAKLNFKHPIVGVHVRRTDKLIQEAKKFELAQYMEHVEKWYNEYEGRTKRTNLTRRVFLSTDDMKVYHEAVEKYPTYQFHVAGDHIANAGKKQRDSIDGLRGIAFDIELLASCDFLVCTFSSNVGRIAYELMFAKLRRVEAVSLDKEYFYGGFGPHLVATSDSSDGVHVGDVFYVPRSAQIKNKNKNVNLPETAKECPWPVKYVGLTWAKESHFTDGNNQSSTCLNWLSQNVL